MIHPSDIAAVAATVLTDGADRRTLVLTGGEAITFDDVAQDLSAATRNPIEFVDVADAMLRRSLTEAASPDWLVTHVSGAFELIRQGALEQTTDVVAATTGRPPRRFADFARDHAAVFRP